MEQQGNPPCSVEFLQKRTADMKSAASEFITGTFEELVDKTSSDNPDVRFLAVTRLRNSDDPRAVPVLIRLIDDRSAQVRSLAAIGLGYYADDSAREVLIDHLRNDENGSVRAMCAGSLGFIGGADNELIYALSDPDKTVKISAIVSLSHSGTLSAVPHIIKLLDDLEWDVRYFASTALLDLGVSNADVVEVLNALRDIPEAIEFINSTPELDIMAEVLEKFSDEYEQMDNDLSFDETLDELRRRHGVEKVPYPPEDPLGDLIERARQLYSQLSE